MGKIQVIDRQAMRQNGCYTKEHHLYIALLYMYLKPDIGIIWVVYKGGFQIERQA